MNEIKSLWNKNGGRLAYHWEICFAPGETNPDEVMEITREWATTVFDDNYQSVIAIHTDKEHIHAHIIFNSVSYVDGIKFRYELNDLERVYYPVLNRLCKDRGLSTVEINPEEDKHGLSYREWLENKKGYPTWKDMIKADIDYAIKVSYSFSSFVVKLEEMGYDVNLNGKYMKVKVPGMEKYSRVYSLGKEYTEENIEKRIHNEYKDIEETINIVSRYKIYRTKVPRKKTKLPKTYFERQYIRYLILLNKKKLKEKPSFVEIQKGRKAAEQLNFMFLNGIRNKTDIVKKQEEVEKAKENLSEDFRLFYFKKKKYKKVFERLYEYRINGDRQAEEWLHKRGYEDVSEIDKIKEAFTDELIELRKRKIELAKKEMMLKSISENNIESEIDFFRKEVNSGRDKSERETQREISIDEYQR